MLKKALGGFFDAKKFRQMEESGGGSMGPPPPPLDGNENICRLFANICWSSPSSPFSFFSLRPFEWQIERRAHFIAPRPQETRLRSYYNISRALYSIL